MTEPGESDEVFLKFVLAPHGAMLHAFVSDKYI